MEANVACKSKKIDIQSVVNRLTPEQACKLIDIASPLSEEERAKFDSMTDDELLKELAK